MKGVLMVRQEAPSQHRGGCRCEDEQKELLQNYMVGEQWFRKTLVAFQQSYSD